MEVESPDIIRAEDRQLTRPECFGISTHGTE